LPKVLIPQSIAEDGKRFLTERGYEIVIGRGISEDVLAEDIQECDAVLARTEKYTEKVLRTARKVKVIARHGVGTDNIDLSLAAELGIYVTTTPMANAVSVAEHSLTLIMALSKKLMMMDKEFKQGHWEVRNQLFGMELEGKTLGVLGLGRIGSILARKAHHGLGMKVIGYDPYVPAERLPEGVQKSTDWNFVFEQSDFISVHLPATPETIGIIGRKEFELMKPTAYFVNAARGEVVNEGDLAAILSENRIAGAGIDVYQEEPLPPDHPFLHMKHVITTPHNASLTEESRTKMALHAAMSIDEILTGKNPSWPANRPNLKGVK
jgi:D-3-phosphoglycerate dehydrogenase